MAVIHRLLTDFISRNEREGETERKMEMKQRRDEAYMRTEREIPLAFWGT